MFAAKDDYTNLVKDRSYRTLNGTESLLHEFQAVPAWLLSLSPYGTVITGTALPAPADDQQARKRRE
jgi:hypothetical protein